MKDEYCIMPQSPLYSTVRIPGYHRHEVFFGRNRRLSIKYGLVVFLPPELHNMSDRGVHFNPEFDKRLKKMGQIAFEKSYPDKSFREIFGKNYL